MQRGAHSSTGASSIGGLQLQPFQVDELILLLSLVLPAHSLPLHPRICLSMPLKAVQWGELMGPAWPLERHILHLGSFGELWLSILRASFQAVCCHSQLLCWQEYEL